MMNVSANWMRLQVHFSCFVFPSKRSGAIFVFFLDRVLKCPGCPGCLNQLPDSTYSTSSTSAQDQCPPLSGQDVQPACVVTQVATSSLSQNPVDKVRTGGVVAMLSEAPNLAPRLAGFHKSAPDISILWS